MVRKNKVICMQGKLKRKKRWLVTTPLLYWWASEDAECILNIEKGKYRLDVVAVPWWRFDTPPHGCCSVKRQLCSSPCSSWRSQTLPRLAAWRQWLSEAGTRSALPERRYLSEPEQAQLFSLILHIKNLVVFLFCFVFLHLFTYFKENQWTAEYSVDLYQSPYRLKYLNKLL